MQRTMIGHRNMNLPCEKCKQKLGEVAKNLNVNYAYFTHKAHGKRKSFCAKCGQQKESSGGK
jgi:hypothetical protein